MKNYLICKVGDVCPCSEISHSHWVSLKLGNTASYPWTHFIDKETVELGGAASQSPTDPGLSPTSVGGDHA